MSRRTEKARELPWVTYLDEPVPCEGFKSGTPLKALYRWGPDRQNPPVGLEPYRCKNSARWHFEALPPEGDEWAAPSGYFCWSHLLSRGIYGTVQERLRTEDFFNAQEVGA